MFHAVGLNAMARMESHRDGFDKSTTEEIRSIFVKSVEVVVYVE